MSEKTNKGRVFSRSLRFTAAVLVFIFSFDTIARSAPLLGQAAPEDSHAFASLSHFIHQFQIPESFGRVESRYEGKSTTAPRALIIHIQDAHSQPEAQRNIEAILEYLSDKGHVSRIS